MCGCETCAWVGIGTSSRPRRDALKSDVDYSTSRWAEVRASVWRSPPRHQPNSVQYTAAMPVDVTAQVIANRPLSRDYNVLALRAPEIAAATSPGQFVMIKTGLGHDPLLRRPFSVFELLRDGRGTPTGISLLNKRIGISTGRIYAAQPDERVACLGPLGRPFSMVDSPTEAWMVAGGVGLAPFILLAERLRHRRVGCTLFYGARRADELFHLDFF